jgi:hypothetical protein
MAGHMSLHFHSSTPTVRLSTAAADREGGRVQVYVGDGEGAEVCLYGPIVEIRRLCMEVLVGLPGEAPAGPVCARCGQPVKPYRRPIGIWSWEHDAGPVCADGLHFASVAGSTRVPDDLIPKDAS